MCCRTSQCYYEQSMGFYCSPPKGKTLESEIWWKREGVVYLKVIRFWSTGRFLPQSPLPLKHPNTNNLATFCKVRSISKCAWNPFSNLKVPSFKKLRCLQHDQFKLLSWFLVTGQLQASLTHLCALAEFVGCIASAATIFCVAGAPRTFPDLAAPGSTCLRNSDLLLVTKQARRVEKATCFPGTLHFKDSAQKSVHDGELAFHPDVLTSAFFVSSLVSLTLFWLSFCIRRQKFPSHVQGYSLCLPRVGCLAPTACTGPVQASSGWVMNSLVLHSLAAFVYGCPGVWEGCFVGFGAISIPWASSASYKSSSFEGEVLAIRVSPPLSSDWSNPPVAKGFC